MDLNKQQELNNPFTGQKYTKVVTDCGVAATPHQSSHLLPSGSGATLHINLEPRSADELVIHLADAAKGLSEMTGFEIEFKDTRDTPAIWGTYGVFVVRNPKLHGL
jgi:hypothetical protein